MRLTSVFFGFAVLLLAAAGSVNAQSQGQCPEGYIPKPALDSDEAPPVLRRGRPEADNSAREQVPGQVECIQAEMPGATEPSEQPFLDQVRDELARFDERLPNFLCRQTVTRFESRQVPAQWRQLDTLSAEILMVDDEETYRDVRRNGRPVSDAEVADTGQWSRGEYGTVLLNLFHPGTRTRFFAPEDTTLDGVAVRRYDYEVSQETSHWKVTFGGTTIEPAYHGRVWIDPDSLRVLRIELAAQDLPAGYSMDTIEMSVDYGPVDIAGQQYILPVRSANLSCQRGTQSCWKNEIVFGNYRHFTAESVITSTDSDIHYDGPVTDGK